MIIRYGELDGYFYHSWPLRQKSLKVRDRSPRDAGKFTFSSWCRALILAFKDLWPADTNTTGGVEAGRFTIGFLSVLSILLLIRMDKCGSREWTFA